MSEPNQVISSRGLKISFRSAEELERENGQQKLIPNSLASNGSICALHPNDSLPAFLDALPTPPVDDHQQPPLENQQQNSANEGANVEKVKKD